MKLLWRDNLYLVVVMVLCFALVVMVWSFVWSKKVDAVKQ